METTKSNARRNFLLAASLGGAAVVAVATAAHTPSQAALETASVQVEKSGYRASPHILSFYKTLEF